MITLNTSSKAFFRNTFFQGSSFNTQVRGISSAVLQNPNVNRTDKSLKNQNAVSISSKQIRMYCSNENKPTSGRDTITNRFGWVNTGTIIKGGGVLLAILAIAGSILYCQNNPDEEVCNTVRDKLGIKKK